ncbi:MAG: Holliday junction resolvase RuvX [Candidatus Gracilibacteria bacterium]|nr:Holliday junction resolvase RuvX [Candidatus Gracilibacteria bacterium]
MKNNMYLGIDLGDKRCGISVYIQGVILPKGIVDRHLLISVLKKLIKEYDITTIVVGLPYDLYGKKLKQLDKTNIFIQKLKNIFPMQKIDGIDERFTSFEADFVLNSMGIKNKIGNKDDISAVLILESYLSKNNS